MIGTALRRLLRDCQPASFGHWLRADDEGSEARFERMGTSSANAAGQREEGLKLYREAREAAKKGCLVSVEIAFPPTGNFTWSGFQPLDFCDLKRPVNFKKIYIGPGLNNTNCVRNARIRSLVIGNNQNAARCVNIQDCWVEDLVVTGGLGFPKKVCIANSWIGRLHLEEGCLAFFVFSGGGLLSVVGPPVDKRSPFVGHVHLSSVWLPSKDGAYKDVEAGPQPWADLRKHLVAMGNFEAASGIRRSELRISRQSQPFLWKIVNIGYDWLSGYGDSLLKPLTWMIMLSLLYFTIYFAFDAAILSTRADVSAWRHSLNSSAERSAWLSVQPIIDPFRLITSGDFVEPATPIFLILHIMHKFVCLLLLFFVILSVRRRFRLEA